LIYILSDKKIDGALNLEVIKTIFFDVEVNLKPYDGLVFTSRKSVIALDRINKEWIGMPSFAVGFATAEAINSFGGRVEFECGDGYAQSLAHEIEKKYSNLKFLHPRGVVTAFDLKVDLSEKVTVFDDVVLYETECNDFSIPAFDSCPIFIFSSPSTVKCFFKKAEWKSSYKAIAIGKTTASSLPPDIKYYLPSKRTLKSAVELAATL